MLLENKIQTELLIDKLTKPLKLMQTCDFEFSLTGSYRFGDYHAKSDINFCAQKNDLITDWLIEVGFEEHHTDDQLFIEGVQLFCKGSVNIQLHDDYNRFERVNHWLLCNPLIYQYIKSMTHPIVKFHQWNMLYLLCK